MKRLTFKPEHVGPILDRTKRRTCRWKDQRLLVGDVVAAVTSKDGKPAFLIPASEAFTELRITGHEEKFWKNFTEDDAQLSGVTRDWYLREKPDAHDLSRIHIYDFEVATE